MAGPPAESPSQCLPAPDAGTICIIWTAAAKPPAALGAPLARRGFALEVAHDRFSAMAAACCAARDGRRPILILDEPSRLKGREEVVEALRGRTPDAVIWTFEAARRPQIAGLDPDRLRATNPPPNGTLQHVQAPLRLVGEPDGATRPEGPVNDASEGDPDRSGLLSPEELEMLLADDPEERGTR